LFVCQAQNRLAGKFLPWLNFAFHKRQVRPPLTNARFGLQSGKLF
jgi:hypothetical protein